LYYPAPDETAEITGAAGTEFVFVVSAGAEQGQVERELEAFWNARPQWPKLASHDVYGLSRTGIDALQRSRDLGPAKKSSDGAAGVVHTLEAMRSKLSGPCEILAGIAFSHD
jgi:hypothetical protein